MGSDDEYCDWVLTGTEKPSTTLPGPSNKMLAKEAERCLLGIIILSFYARACWSAVLQECFQGPILICLFKHRFGASLESELRFFSSKVCG